VQSQTEGLGERDPLPTCGGEFSTSDEVRAIIDEKGELKSGHPERKSALGGIYKHAVAGVLVEMM